MSANDQKPFRSTSAAPASAVHQEKPSLFPAEAIPFSTAAGLRSRAKPHDRNPLLPTMKATAREQIVRVPRRVRHSGPATEDFPQHGLADRACWHWLPSEEKAGDEKAAALPRFPVPMCPCSRLQ